MSPNPAQFVDQLATRLLQPLPGRDAQCKFSHELAYGRHFGMPSPRARAAAVLLLVYSRGDAWHIPLTLRSTQLSVHGGQISLPGGRVEPGETAREAALRETNEELAIEPERVRLLGPLSRLYLYGSDFLVTPFVAWLEHAPAFRPNAAEVAEIIELPLSLLLDPACHGQHGQGRGAVRFRAPHISCEGHRIWGATAMILAEFAEIVQGCLGGISP